jgi:hypothetical protein
LLGSVSIPLLDGGAARAQVRVQSAALEQARVAYEATVLRALQDVENSLAALQQERARSAALVEAVAPLNHLLARGEVRRTGRDGVWYWVAATGSAGGTPPDHNMRRAITTPGRTPPFV